MSKSKLNIRKASFLLSSGIGTGVSLLVSLLAAVLISIFLSNEYIEFSASGFAVIISQFLAAFLGATAACKVAKEENKLSSCCCSVGLYYLLFSCAGMLLFDGVSFFALYGAFSCIGGCVLSILTCFRAKNRSSKKRGKRRSR